MAAKKTTAKTAKNTTVKTATIAQHYAALAPVKLEDAKVETATLETTNEESKESKLAAMLASANEVKTEVAATVSTVKYVASSSKNDDGTNKQKRNTNTNVRSIAVVVSAKLNTCWLGTHLAFATKANATALNVFKNAPQQALKVMQQADDLVLTVVAHNVLVGNELESAKLAIYNEYAALGYTMLCRKAKVENTVLAEANTSDAALVTA